MAFSYGQPNTPQPGGISGIQMTPSGGFRIVGGGGFGVSIGPAGLSIVSGTGTNLNNPTSPASTSKKSMDVSQNFPMRSRVFLACGAGQSPQFVAAPNNPYYPQFVSQPNVDTDGLRKQCDAEDIPVPLGGTVVDFQSTGNGNELSVRVMWDNGQYNGYVNASDLMNAKKFIETYITANKSIHIKGVKVEELEKLVLSNEKKRSIVAVMKQHQHRDKIFKEWGLGEVIEYGKGMTMLFYGPPGTGKTYAAQCIAKALGKPLSVMDNAKLQSSTPGEMERSIKKAFEEAKVKKEVLMFDECDSLLMTRANVGMILGSEINCLLTEIEKFDGVCILTTNRIGELDEALERRISLILKFPKPKAEQRRAIWKKFMPSKLPLHEDVNMDDLVSFELTGGLIKNVVLNAARLAVADDRDLLQMSDFMEAIKNVAKGQIAFQSEAKTPRTHVASASMDKVMSSG